MTTGRTCGVAGWGALVFCAVALFAPSARAQFGATGLISTTTVRVDGITCTSALGSNIFPISSWNWTMQQQSSGSISAGGRTSAGRAVSSDVSITRNLDACSPALALASARGFHLRRVEITQYDRDSYPLITVRLDDVVVSSYKTQATPTQASPGEELTLHFRTIKTSQPRGGFGWDFVTNRQM